MVDLKTAIHELNTGKIEFVYKEDDCCTTEGEVVILLKRLEELEKADFKEVKHGHWEKGGVWGDTGSVAYRCTACGETTYDGDYFIYCPKCGARMESR